MALNQYTSTTLADPNAEELAGINRQQALANALMTQGMQGQPQGQVVNGYYVKPSFLQALNPVAQQLAGSYLGKQAEQKALDYAAGLRQKQAEETQKIMQTAMGAPAQMYEQQAGPMQNGGNIPQQVQTPAQQPDLQQAYQLAANAQTLGGKALAAPLLANAIPKKTNELINYEAYKADNGKLPFTAWVDRNENQRLDLEKQRFKLEQARFSREATNAAISPQENQLRTSFLNQAQPHIQISQAYRKIEAAPETAAGDMSRIFGYMKILDPGSTVREGEYASAENARGVPASVMAQYNRVLNGQRLTPQQRNEFTQSAGDLVNSQKQQFGDVAKYYSDISGRYGVNPQNIIYDPYQGLELKTTPPKTPKTQNNVNQQLNIPQNGGWNIISVTK